MAVAYSPGYSSYAGLVQALADKYGLPVDTFAAIIDVSSGYDNDAFEVDYQGRSYFGLGKVRDTDLLTYGVDPGNPAQNLEVSARVFRALLDKYRGNVADAVANYGTITLDQAATFFERYGLNPTTGLARGADSTAGGSSASPPPVTSPEAAGDGILEGVTSWLRSAGAGIIFVLIAVLLVAFGLWRVIAGENRGGA